MRCSHCGSQLGLKRTRIDLLCGEYMLLGEDFCRPVVSAVRSSTPDEKAAIASAVRSIIETKPA